MLAVRQWLTWGDVLANDKLGRRSVVSTTQQRFDHRISFPTSQLYVQQVELVPIAGGWE